MRSLYCILFVNKICTKQLAETQQLQNKELVYFSVSVNGVTCYVVLYLSHIHLWFQTGTLYLSHLRHTEADDVVQVNVTNDCDNR